MPIKHVKLLQTIWTLCIALQFLLHFKFIGIAVKSMPIMKFVVFCDKIETNRKYIRTNTFIKKCAKTEYNFQKYVCVCVYLICINNMHSMFIFATENKQQHCRIRYAKYLFSIHNLVLQNMFEQIAIFICLQERGLVPLSQMRI